MTFVTTSSCEAARGRRAAGRAAFTLIELLVVVMVIAILYGMLLSAIRTVQRHTLQTVTRGELKNIENAWKQYFAHYQVWPETDGAEETARLIDGDMAWALQGVTNSAWAARWNRDGIVFMEFSRLDADDGRPLNAWGESRRFEKDLCSYYVAFDIDGDNQIEVRPCERLGSPGASPATNVFRGVVVWTFNPEIKDRATGMPAVMGSWQR
jgi:prepilin-type N-terminal cleavage/methylation domain-containing protein